MSVTIALLYVAVQTKQLRYSFGRSFAGLNVIDSGEIGNSSFILSAESLGL
jgi:hypothetical protein